MLYVEEGFLVYWTADGKNDNKSLIDFKYLNNQMDR